MTLAASAQSADKTVEKIRGYYTGIAEKVRLAETDDDQGEYGALVMNELAINSRHHQWRAIGIYGKTFRFFYKGGESEKHLYPDQLVFVKAERRESNRNYSEEFLYSESGALLFYFQSSENDELAPAERRIYFSGSKAVRVVEDGKSRDRLTTKDLGIVKDVLVLSGQIKEIFNRSIKL